MLLLFLFVSAPMEKNQLCAIYTTTVEDFAAVANYGAGNIYLILVNINKTK